MQTLHQQGQLAVVAAAAVGVGQTLQTSVRRGVPLFEQVVQDLFQQGAELAFAGHPESGRKPDPIMAGPQQLQTEGMDGADAGLAHQCGLPGQMQVAGSG